MILLKERIGFFRSIISKSRKAKMLAVLCIFLVVVICVLLLVLIDKSRLRAEYDFKSRLIEAIDIGELSTSKLIYNGIVDIYDEKGQKVVYSIAYDSTIKVGVQVEDIDFNVDAAQKTVRIVLPDISIQTPVIDASSLNFIPSNPSIDLKTAIAACRDDALREAEQSEKLIQTAKENLKSIIEALTLPLLKDEGYAIEW